MLRKIINESYNDSIKFVGELADYALYYIMWSGENSKDVDLGHLIDNMNLRCPENLMLRRAASDLKGMIDEEIEVPTETDFLYRITDLSNNEIEMDIIYQGEIQGTVVFYINNFKVRMKCIYEKP